MPGEHFTYSLPKAGITLYQHFHLIDLLVYGNAERAIVEIAHRAASGEAVREIRDLRGTAFVRKRIPDGWTVVDSSTIDTPGPVEPPIDPYQDTTETSECKTKQNEADEVQTVRVIDPLSARKLKLMDDRSHG